MRSITRLLCDSRATCYHSALRPTTCWNVTSARDSKPRPGPVPRPLPEMWITSHFNFFGQICRKNLMPWFQNHCLPVMKVLLTIGGYCFFGCDTCGSVGPCVPEDGMIYVKLRPRCSNSGDGYICALLHRLSCWLIDSRSAFENQVTSTFHLSTSNLEI